MAVVLFIGIRLIHKIPKYGDKYTKLLQFEFELSDSHARGLKFGACWSCCNG